MTPSCGTSQNLHCVMMHRSLYHASTMHLWMRFDDIQGIHLELYAKHNLLNGGITS